MVLGKLPVPGRPTIWITVGQGPTALAVSAGAGCLDIFTLIYPFSPLSPYLWETARKRLKYCLKGPLTPKQPTNQPNHHIKLIDLRYFIKIEGSQVVFKVQKYLGWSLVYPGQQVLVDFRIQSTISHIYSFIPVNNNIRSVGHSKKKTLLRFSTNTLSATASSPGDGMEGSDGLNWCTLRLCVWSRQNTVPRTDVSSVWCQNSPQPHHMVLSKVRICRVLL